MSLDNTTLLEFLGEVDKELRRKVVVVAAGGTAMTLLRAKASTIDVDFTISQEDYEEFVRALNAVPHGFKVDHYKDGAVFSQILPADYIIKSGSIITKMRNITLKALSPIDIIVTKIGRLNDRDKDDIAKCIQKFKITKSQITKRAAEVEYVGREENYEINLNHVLKNFFKPDAK
jgi:phosphorylcholine metabolism protein LicD